MRREPQLVLGSLRRSSCDLLVAGRMDIVSTLLASLCDRVDRRIPPKDAPKLKAALTSALFGAEALDIALRKLVEDPSKLDVLAPTLRGLPPSELPRLLALLRQPCPPPVVELVIELASRLAPGAETEIGKAATAAAGDVRTRLLELLASANTPAAKETLFTLAQSEDAALRMEARMLSGGDDRSELFAALDGSPQMRMSALRLLVRHNVRSAWPAVKRLYDKNGFHDLGTDEKREILRALVLLSPEDGEALALELAKKGGLLRSDAREASRVTAAHVLGEISRSAATAGQLAALAQSRWGVSDELRDAARTAADRIGQRIAGGAS
jgi:hypothetical protein